MLSELYKQAKQSWHPHDRWGRLLYGSENGAYTTQPVKNNVIKDSQNWFTGIQDKGWRPIDKWGRRMSGGFNGSTLPDLYNDTQDGLQPISSRIGLPGLQSENVYTPTNRFVKPWYKVNQI